MPCVFQHSDRSFRCPVLIPLLGLISACSIAAISAEEIDPDQISFVGESAAQADDARGRMPRMYQGRIRPTWSSDGDCFWYRKDLSGDRSQYILVIPARKERREAFDHEKLAVALGQQGVQVDPARLNLGGLHFNLTDGSLSFQIEQQTWTFHPARNRLIRHEEPGTIEMPEDAALREVPFRSSRTGSESSLTVVNRTGHPVKLKWLDRSGKLQDYGQIKSGESRDQHTYAGHVWVVLDRKNELLAAYRAEPQHLTVAVTGRVSRYAGRRTERRPESSSKTPGADSPDGRWSASIHDHNIVLVSRENGVEQRLTADGEAGNEYGRLQWIDQGETLLAWRIHDAARKTVHLIDAYSQSTERAVVRTRDYPLPGDELDAHELNLFRISDGQQLRPDLEPFDFGRPRTRISTDAGSLLVEKVDRGHQRFRVFRVDLASGDVRVVVDEQTKTFLWTQHGPPVAVMTYLNQSDRAIHATERSGWRQLELIDLRTGKVQAITSGEWVVRGIQRIDEEKEQIWFSASGLDEGQDPYLLHFLRVNFNGENLTRLTAGDGTHSIDYSPDRRYLIDSWSRVDNPPQHVLRDAQDGTLICELETADISELTASGWRAPEVFHAPGRDGQTEIWGMICWPDEFDPERKYAVIEDIYAGPHDSHVPKAFSPAKRYRSLIQEGFIVVKIDGMGTANRSKSFHDVCWQNLKDAGFPDRISWMRAAAKRYPALDLSRVGIYGTSAGGQNAAAAVLFHSDFYRVAVASCGCHDNRMDKLSWNEQWMGFPVGPHYLQSSNIENAHRLGGHLMLILGDLDTNVPPESTTRFVQALVEADKDFEFVLIPGMGHSSGGRYGERRRIRFFKDHLLETRGD